MYFNFIEFVRQWFTLCLKITYAIQKNLMVESFLIAEKFLSGHKSTLILGNFFMDIILKNYFKLLMMMAQLFLDVL